MKIIDVHTHCFTLQSHAPAVMRDLVKLRRAGLLNMVVAGMVNTDLDTSAMWNLVPDYVEHWGEPSFNETEDLLELTRLSEQFFLPFVDTRHLSGDIPKILGAHIRQGYRGIKGIYLPDDGNDIGVRGVPETFGITLQQYLKREWEIFSFAQAQDLPVLYHIDSRKYGDVMVAILKDFPTLRIDFAHLGIGRKTFAAILDRFPNAYTDIANLLPHINSNPASYRDFIMHYPDRICFGSDAFLYQTGVALGYIDCVKNLALPEEVETQLFYGNPVRFLGSALHVRSVESSESGQRFVNRPPTGQKQAWSQ